MTRTTAACALVLLWSSACFSEDTGGATMSSADSGGSTAGTEPSGPGTNAQSSSTTDNPDTTTSLGSTSETTGSSSGESSTGSSSTGEASDPCWDSGDAWTIAEFDTAALHPGFLVSAVLDPSGLQLSYTTETGQGRTSYIASRETRDDPFIEGSRVGKWATGVPLVAGVRFTGADELLSLLNDGEVSTSTFADGLWWPPEASVFAAPPTALLGTPTFFDAALGLMIEVRDGPSVEGTPTFISYETTRLDVDAAFDPLERLRIPEWDDGVPVLCVIPATNGERIVFGGAFPVLWTDPPEMFEGALDIWYAERLADDSWGPPTKFETASHDTLLACPTSITSDGCAMTVRHSELGDGVNELFLATR